MAPPEQLASGIEDALRNVLSGGSSNVIADLARLLAQAGSEGRTSGSGGELAAGAGVEALLRELKGKSASAGATAIDFGTNNDIQTVTIRNSEIAGGDIIKVRFELQDSSYDVSGLSNPYVGLEPFTRDLAARYAGREAQVQEALAWVDASPAQRGMLFISGASGSGKSSFVQAGVLPALEGHYTGLGDKLLSTVLRPGHYPIAQLADALTRLGLSDESDSFEARASLTGSDQFLQRLDRTPPRQVNLIVLDQLEELFTQSEPAQRDLFLALLAGMPSFDRVRTHVIATLRIDYATELERHSPQLFDVWRLNSIFLRKMTSKELQRAIQRPIQERNEEHDTDKRWQEELVTRLAGEAAADVTYLPLLQVTLEEIWRKGRLTLDRYKTLTDALEEHAEAVFTDHDRRSEDERTTIMALFRDLVRVSLDNDPRHDTRRGVVKLELAEGRPDRLRLIDELVRARLLSIYSESRGQGRVEVISIIHETLLSNWKRLASAIQDQWRPELLQRERFYLALGDWIAQDRSDRYLLKDVRLDEARALATRGDIALRSADGSAFLQRSITAADTQRRRREYTTLAVVLVIAALSLSLAVFAQWSATTADNARRNAASRGLAAESAAILHSEPALGLLLGVEAWRQADTAEARTLLLTALVARPPTVMRWNAPLGLVDTVALSSAGNFAVAQSRRPAGGSTLQLWRVTPSGLQPEGPSLDSPDPFDRLAVSSGGSVIGVTRRRIERFALRESALQRVSNPVEVPVNYQIGALAVSSDGSAVAVREFRPRLSSVVQTWRISDAGFQADEPQDTKVGYGQVASTFHSALALSADGTFVAFGDENDTTVQVRKRTELGAKDATEFDLKECDRCPSKSGVARLAFDESGKTLAVLTSDGVINLAEVRDEQNVFDLRPGDPLRLGAAPDALQFDHDANLLAVATADGKVRLLQRTSDHLEPIGQPLELPAGSTSVTFSQDAEALLTAQKSAIQAWKLDPQPLGTLLTRSEAGYDHLAFAGSGDVLAAERTGQIDAVNTSGSGSKVIYPRKFGQSSLALTIGQNASVLALATTTLDQPRLELIDVGGGSPLNRKPSPLPPTLAQAALSQDGVLLATEVPGLNAGDGMVQLWTIVDYELSERGSPVAVQPYADALGFSQDGKLLATASRDGELAIARVTETGLVLLGARLGLGTSASALSFDRTGTLLGVATTDGKLRFITLTDGTVLQQYGQPLEFGTPVANLAFSPREESVAVSLTDGKLWLLPMDPRAWADFACRVAGRDLSAAEWAQYLPGEQPRATCMR